MSCEVVRAVQGWRWMARHPHVQQSFIVRVPEAELEAELARQRAATAALPGWLPTPNIVEVPAVEPTSDDVVERTRAALDWYRRARADDDRGGEAVNCGNMAGDALADLVTELLAEVDRALAEGDWA